MTPPPSEIECDLMIIGTGMTGLAAGLFAAERGIDAVQVGLTGELNFASGLIDLMGVHPVEKSRVWQDPWAAIDALVQACPEHPYARVPRNDLRAALKLFLDFLSAHGLPYQTAGHLNSQVATPAGTLKSTYAVPTTMLNGVRALADQAPALIVDINGLKGFSGRQMAETLSGCWPGLRSGGIRFPGAAGELYPERLGQHLELAENRRRLAAALQPLIDKRVAVVGVPAILGLYQPMAVFEDLQQRLQRPLFEIPTMPPAITGLRLRTLFEQQLPRRGIRCFFQHRVVKAQNPGAGPLVFDIGPHTAETRIRARGAILATGRFFGKGLQADRKSISESVFGLPVLQPESRTRWHRKSFLDVRGHAVNRAGLQTDAKLRPLDAGGQAAHGSLFAAGSILAHQDWMRQKCGSGLAIATAYMAVKHFAGSRA